MSAAQVAMSGAEFLAHGWSTSYHITDASIAIVYIGDDDQPAWTSWDEGGPSVEDRCNPDIDLLDDAGQLLRASGPRSEPPPPPPALADVLGGIAAGPGTQDQKIAAILAALAEAATPSSPV